MNLRNQRYVAATVVGFILAAASRVLGADFQTETGWNDQLFPSFIIATATLKLPRRQSKTGPRVKR